MSNLWAHDRGAVASVGSFAIPRGADPEFRAWTKGSGDIVNECGDIPLDLVQIRAEGFAEGFEEARRLAVVELAGERAALAALAESLEALRPEPTNALAALLAATVERLVGQIVGAAPVDPELLIRRAEAAAALIGEEIAPSRLRLHPEDKEIVSAAGLGIVLVADPSLARGTLVLETAGGWIEDGPAVRLDRLRAELDRLGAR